MTGTISPLLVKTSSVIFLHNFGEFFATMAQIETTPVTIPAEQQGPQTRPVEPERRLKDDDIRIEVCTVDDAMTLVSEQHGDEN